MAAIVGDLAAAEEIKALKDLMAALRRHQSGLPPGRRQDRRRPAPDLSVQYRPSPGVEAADAILLVGANPRWDAPVLNARIRKAWLAGGVKVANIGPAVDLTYPVEQLGTDVAVLEADRQWQPRLRQGAERRQAADDRAGLGRADPRATAPRS